MAAPVAKRTYFLVWLSLMALLLATVGFSRLDLKEWNVVIALAIATLKATLVILFFMHARSSSRLVWIAGGAGLVWLLILLELTLSDYLTRGPTWHS